MYVSRIKNQNIFERQLTVRAALKLFKQLQLSATQSNSNYCKLFVFFHDSCSLCLHLSLSLVLPRALYLTRKLANKSFSHNIYFWSLFRSQERAKSLQSVFLLINCVHKENKINSFSFVSICEMVFFPQ